mgnify:CR=1 FL=1
MSQGLPIVEQSTYRTLTNKMIKIEDAILGDKSLKDFDGSEVLNGYFGKYPIKSIVS